MKKISEILKNKKPSIKDNVSNVNVYNDNNKYLNNVDEKINNAVNNLMDLLNEKTNKPKTVAEEIRKKLGDDPKNLNFHIKMAKNYDSKILFECLSIALDAQRNNKVNTSLPKYYVGILKRKGFLHNKT